MISKLTLQRFSLPELVIGAAALATALVAYAEQNAQAAQALRRLVAGGAGS